MSDNMNTFIDSVQNRPCLWNSDDPDHKSLSSKALAWKEVFQECGELCKFADVKDMKYKWKMLRVTHRNILRRQLGNEDTLNTSGTTWPYMDVMEFLVAYVKKDVSQSGNVEEILNDDDDDNLDNSQVVNEESIAQPSTSGCVKTPAKKSGKKCTKIAKSRDESITLEVKDDNEHNISKIPTSKNSNNEAMKRFFSSMFHYACDLPAKEQMNIQEQLFVSVMGARKLFLEQSSLNETQNADYEIDRVTDLFESIVRTSSPVLSEIDFSPNALIS